MRTKTVLITGASTGIGRDAAKYLSQRGYRALAGVRNEADAQSIRDEKIDGLEPVFIDVADEGSIAACVASVEKIAGGEGLGALVNNAGIAVSSPLEFVPLEAFRRQFEINVTGQVAVTQAFMPLIRKGGGRIVFVGSTSGYLAAPFVGPYAASKHALEAISDSLRRELKPWGIPVSIVQPGAIQTPIWEKSEKTADDLLENLPQEAKDFYGETVDTVKSRVHLQAANASPVELVSKSIFQAVDAARPKARYKPGLEPWIQLFIARMVPTPIADWILAKFMGL